MTYNLPSIFDFTAIPFQHVRELLRIFNWRSAPYGSEEWLYKNCGSEGIHFEFDENVFPITNDRYAEENGSLTAYIGGSVGVNRSRAIRRSARCSSRSPGHLRDRHR